MSKTKTYLSVAVVAGIVMSFLLMVGPAKAGPNTTVLKNGQLVCLAAHKINKSLKSRIRIVNFGNGTVTIERIRIFNGAGMIQYDSDFDNFPGDFLRFPELNQVARLKTEDVFAGQDAAFTDVGGGLPVVIDYSTLTGKNSTPTLKGWVEQNHSNGRSTYECKEL